jgi:uncharacterized protein YprB with RNaseH-like and TPR domain
MHVENRLKKHLEIIKARAKKLRALYLARGAAARRPTGPDPRRTTRSHNPSALAEPPHRTFRPPDGLPRRLEDVVPGNAKWIAEQPFFLVRSSGDDIAEGVSPAVTRFTSLTGRPAWPMTIVSNRENCGDDASPREPSTARLPGVRADRVCFFDIETTGLSPAMYVFLCGFMFLENNQFVIEQAFARDYSEEIGLLAYVKETFGRFDLAVTYNGACFDLPFIKTRMAVSRMAYQESFDALDLLGPARRSLSAILPNCKLETIERHLRGHDRLDNISGRDIPDAYHHFVRTGDARLMKNVLCHNRMDLFAMVLLLNHIGCDDTH